MIQRILNMFRSSPCKTETDLAEQLTKRRAYNGKKIPDNFAVMYVAYYKADDTISEHRIGAFRRPLTLKAIENINKFFLLKLREMGFQNVRPLIEEEVVDYLKTKALADKIASDLEAAERRKSMH